MLLPRFRSFFAAGRLLLLTLALPACQRAAYLPTARLAPATSQSISPALPDDPAAAALIRPYRDKVVGQMAEVLGTAPLAISKGAGESPLVNFVGDLQRLEAGRALGRPIDLGLVTVGAVRAPLPAGPITLENVFELMPFENELVVMELPAEALRQLFGFAAQKKLAISGATYTVSPDGQPIDIRVAGRPLDPAAPRRYTLATSDYLAAGGDNLDAFRGLPFRTTGLKLRNVIADHIRQLTKAGRPVEARVEGRVKIL